MKAKQWLAYHLKLAESNTLVQFIIIASVIVFAFVLPFSLIVFKVNSFWLVVVATCLILFLSIYLALKSSLTTKHAFEYILDNILSGNIRTKINISNKMLERYANQLISIRPWIFNSTTKHTIKSIFMGLLDDNIDSEMYKREVIAPLMRYLEQEQKKVQSKLLNKYKSELEQIKSTEEDI